MLIAIAGFLPVVTMRGVPARLATGLTAAILTLAVIVSLAVGPNAGIGGILWVIALVLALGGLIRTDVSSVWVPDSCAWVSS